MSHRNEEAYDGEFKEEVDDIDYEVEDGFVEEVDDMDSDDFDEEIVEEGMAALASSCACRQSITLPFCFVLI